MTDYVSNRWYNDEIGKQIEEMPISTNILEHYDNVTYNIGLYMFPRDTQEKIEFEMFENDSVDIHKYKKIIIAQSGVTSKFSINSLRMSNKFGINSTETSIFLSKSNIKIFESYGCNFANELGFITKICGYESYFQRPIWLEIWFTGYDQVTGEPIEKIDLPNGHNSIVACGYLGTIKNNISHMGTEWDIEFVPIYKTLVNDRYNYLSVDSIIKNNVGVKLDEFMKNHVKNIYNKFIDSFPLETRAQREAYIGKEYDNDPENFIKINYYVVKNGEYYIRDKEKEVDDEKVEKLEDGDMPILEKNIGTAVDENGSSSYKTDVSMTFTSVCQDFLHYSIKHKEYIARYYIKSKIKKYILGIPLFQHEVDIVLEKNERIAYELEQYSLGNFGKKINVEMKSDDEGEAIKTQMFYRYIGNHTLEKKYQFAFSGEDTSIIDMKSKMENLYYLPATSYDKKLNGESVTKYSKDNDIRILNINDDSIIKTSDEFSEDAYLEDLYRDNRESLSPNDYTLGLVKMNDIDSSDNLKNTSSANTETDNKIIDAMILYKRFYKSGSLSTIKMDIYGDPYWLSMSAQNIDTKNILDKFNVIPNDKMVRNNFKFVFILKTCPEQTNGLDSPFDYTFEDSIYISGIYLITDCESIFENGKFTQSLTGVLDVSLIKDDILF